MRRSATLVAAVSALVAALLWRVPTPAGADPVGSCAATTGTIVAVDFRHWGGPVVRGCGAHSPNGHQLLLDAGFTVAGDVHDGNAFVCRLGNAAFHDGTPYPTPAQDACVLTPPATAYWSYWLAPPGATTWTYSPLGAYGDRPQAGGVELWQFGATNIAGTAGRPTLSPAALRATNRAVTTHPLATTQLTTPRATVTTHPPASRGATRAAGATSKDGPSSHRPASSSRAATTQGTTARSSTSTSARTVSSASSAGSDVLAGGAAPGPTTAVIVTAKPSSAATKASSGSAGPVLVAVLIVAVLGGGGLAAAWRRRRSAAQ